MAALPNMTEDQMKLMQDLEIEMMSDIFTRMTNACYAKCIPTKFRDGELGKGEAVCLDRLVPFFKCCNLYNHWSIYFFNH